MHAEQERERVLDDKMNIWTRETTSRRWRKLLDDKLNMRSYVIIIIKITISSTMRLTHYVDPITMMTECIKFWSVNLK